MSNLKNKILYRKIFNLFAPHLTNRRREKNRKRLQNHDFTILSSNCIGGIMYHELGKKFLSPFINLQVPSNEFCCFLKNPKYYLEQELVFFNGPESYPMAHLGDITLGFTHYATAEEARECWKARKERIHWDNLYIALNDCDRLTEEDIRSLQDIPCKNMVIFTSHKFENCPHTFYMPQFKGQDHVGNILYHLPVSGAWYFEKYFDYVGWLNSEKANCEEFRLSCK